MRMIVMTIVMQTIEITPWQWLILKWHMSKSRISEVGISKSHILKRNTLWINCTRKRANEDDKMLQWNSNAKTWYYYPAVPKSKLVFSSCSKGLSSDFVLSPVCCRRDSLGSLFFLRRLKIYERRPDSKKTWKTRQCEATSLKTGGHKSDGCNNDPRHSR